MDVSQPVQQKFLDELLFISFSRIMWNGLSLLFLGVDDCLAIYFFWIEDGMNQRFLSSCWLVFFLQKVGIGEGTPWDLVFWVIFCREKCENTLLVHYWCDARWGIHIKRKNIIFQQGDLVQSRLEVSKAYRSVFSSWQLRIILLNITLSISSFQKELKQAHDSMEIATELPFVLLDFPLSSFLPSFLE